MKRLILLTIIALCVNIVKAQWQQTSAQVDAGYGMKTLATDGTNILFGELGYGVYLSNDNGNNWITINNGLTGGTIHSTFIKSLLVCDTNILASTLGGVFRYSYNNATWTDVNFGLPSTWTNTLTKSGTKIYTVIDGDKIYSSANNGNSWTLVDSSFTLIIYCIAVNDTNIFVGTYNDGVLLSTNNGASWTTVNTGLPPSSRIRTINANGNSVFIGTDNGAFLSTNNGTNWISINNGLTDSKVLDFAFSGTKIFAGTGHGVFLSNNNGSQWSNVSNGLPDTTVFDLEVNNLYLYAKDSIGLWKRPLTELSVSENNDNRDFNLYPNPTNGNFVINSNFNIKSIEVINVLGKVIYLNTENNFQNNYEIDLSAVMKGIYFVKLDNGELIRTEKIIIY